MPKKKPKTSYRERMRRAKRIGYEEGYAKGLAKERDTHRKLMYQAKERSYNEGLTHGLRRLQKLYENLRHVNGLLFEGLNILDDTDPVVGVTLPFKFAERIEGDVKQINPKHAYYLRRRIKYAKDKKAIQELMRELQESGEE